MPPEPPAPPVTPNNIYYRPQPQQKLEDLQAKYREDVDSYNISLFVHRAIDACNFLIILSPFFPTLSPDLPIEARSFLVNTQLRDLICTPTGLNMAQLLMERCVTITWSLTIFPDMPREPSCMNSWVDLQFS
jgi:hypothetical protein